MSAIAVGSRTQIPLFAAIGFIFARWRTDVPLLVQESSPFGVFSGNKGTSVREIQIMRLLRRIAERLSATLIGC
jgi:hypothetical protein